MNNIAAMEDDTQSVTNGDVGIVERICLKNFMCHGYLDVKLGSHINFIIGRNGSGKSAVATALVVGLGGTALSTCRGNNIRSFVMTGKRQSEVTIQLRNCGTDAYRHETFGDAIIIQRRISSDGATRYIIKDNKGQRISDKGEDVKKIKDFFNIQVDNPVVVLNQDTSRNFLHSRNPADKYKLFLRATQLEQLRTEYSEISISKKKAALERHQYQLMLPNLRDQVLKWEEQCQRLSTTADLRGKVRNLKMIMAWAFVIEKEKALEPFQQRLRTEEAQMSQFVLKVSSTQASLNKKDEQLSALKTQLFAVTEDVEQLGLGLQKHRELFNYAKSKRRIAQNDMKKFEHDLQICISDRQQILDLIVKLQRVTKSDPAGQQKRRAALGESLQEQLHATELRQRTAQHEKDVFLAAKRKATEDSRMIEQDIQLNRNEVKAAARSLHFLKSRRTDKLQCYGGWVPSVQARVEECSKNGRFHRAPRGPLGVLFQLKEPCWALAIESCLRSLIHSFIVHDHHDERLLVEIFQSVLGRRRRPTVITSSFRDKLHDVSKFRVLSSKYPAVLDMLECSDHVVMNALIDQRGIENIIMITTAKEARNVMMNSPPTKCQEAFTLEGDQLYCQHAFRIYSCNQASARFLTSDVENDIRKQQAATDDLNRQIQEKVHQKLTVQKQIDSNSEQERRCGQQLVSLTETLENFRSELMDLSTVEEASVDISALEVDVASYDGKVASIAALKNKSASVLKEEEAVCIEAEKRFWDADRRLKAQVDSDMTLKDDVQNANMVVESSERQHRYYMSCLEEHRIVIDRTMEIVAAMEEDIEMVMEKARKVCPERIETRRKPKNIENEIKQISLHVSLEDEYHLDAGQVICCYKESKQRYLNAHNELSSFKQFERFLDQVLVRRDDAYKKFRKCLDLRIKYYFMMMLASRQFTGNMMFDHDKQSLEMVDLVNRRIAMDLMLEMTQMQCHKQFIFLTPLDMSQLSISSMPPPKIFQMPTPDRTFLDQSSRSNNRKRSYNAD